MYTLIGLGVALAYVFSIAAVIAPGLFPQEFREHGGAVGAYFEAAAVIVTLVLFGEVLQLRAIGPDQPGDPRAAGARAEHRNASRTRRARGGSAA